MATIPIILSFRGQTTALEDMTMEHSGHDLYQRTGEVLGIFSNTSPTISNPTSSSSSSSSLSASIKILAKGKRLPDTESDSLKNILSLNKTASLAKIKKPLKLIVLATSESVQTQMANQRSDPTIRGFEDEKKREELRQESIKVYRPWGRLLPNYDGQDPNYKFCRFEECSWQSFGHRVPPMSSINQADGTSQPHAFAARQLLERLAMDPGVVAVLRERELVVGTLGEMDPIDDRIMKQKEAHGNDSHGKNGCVLLGYNTNGGSRIDLKLRTDDLKGFRPYPELVTTLLHELSHNWVGEHNIVFWTNYAQMRVEYLVRHKALQAQLVNGKTTAELAGLDASILNEIPETVLRDLVHDMMPHGLHPRLIEAPIRHRYTEMEAELLQGQKLGSLSTKAQASQTSSGVLSARERALAAAERRRSESREDGEESTK